MISGNRRHRRNAALVFVLAWLCASILLAAPARADNTAAHPGSDLQQIMLGLQSVKQSQAKFTERKYLQMLDQPLVSSGTLIYVAPDHLEKNTDQPKPESLVVDGESLVVTGADGQSRSLSLADYPQLGAIVEGIRATLAGDSGGLNRFYTVHLQGGLSAWTLVLEPRDPKVQAILRAIRIGGSNARIETVETLEAGGDRSVMTVLPMTVPAMTVPAASP
jgi:outer membrane lipoprotein-sorting protein